jgi:hypothetical protein
MAADRPRIRYLNGKIVLPVFLLDNSQLRLLVEPTTTAADVAEMMANKIGLPDPEDDAKCFAIHECRDGFTIGRPMHATDLVVPRMQSWSSPHAKYVYMCKLFTETIIHSRDPKIQNLLYIQGVYNVISGIYPSSREDAERLAALQVRAKFGRHDPAVHRPGFMTSSIVEYVPGPHLEGAGTRIARQWEESIFRHHLGLVTEVPKEQYLSILRSRDYYGSAMFAVRQRYSRKLPKKLFLAISRRGIVLLRIPESFTSGEMETLARYPLGEIFRWTYRPGETFAFEVKPIDSPDPGDANLPTFKFETPEG